MSQSLFPRLAATVRALQSSFDEISPERRARLEELSDFVRAADPPAQLIFICTHNSRRSHMAQIWAQCAAALHGLPTVRGYSGGTEATAFDLRAVEAMRRAGFEIEAGGKAANPRYRVRFGPEAPIIEAFSKRYDEAPNPTEGFCAVMTCSDADANCPVVIGAAARVVIPYADPKAFDGTASETEMYDERCRQIGTEMLYAFRR